MRNALAWLLVGTTVGLLSQSCGSSDNKKNARRDTDGGEGGASDGGEPTSAGSPSHGAVSGGGAGGAGGAPVETPVAGAAGTPEATAGAAGGGPVGCETPCTNDHGETACEDATCVPSCDDGFGDCDGNPSNGCETDLVDNDEHCGACGRDCSSEGALCVVDSCGDIPMQTGVSIGIGNGAFNDHTFAFSAEAGIANMSRTGSVVRFFGLDGTTSKVVWDTTGGNSSNETLIFEDQSVIWAQQGAPNVVRKKAVSAASNTPPTDLFFPEDLPVYFRSQGDYYYWISGDYGEPGNVYRRLRSAAQAEPGTRIVDVLQGYAQNISGFAVTTDAIYWVTDNDYDAATLDNDIRTTPLTGGVPTSVPKVAGATDGQIKDIGTFTIVPNLTAVGDTLYFARTVGETTLNGIYSYKQGDAAPTKIVEGENITTFAVGAGWVYYGLLNQQGVWRAPITGGQGVKVGQSYQSTIVGIDDKFAYVAFVNQPSYFYKIFH